MSAYSPFGHAVREAVWIFEVYENPLRNENNLQIMHWRSPASKADFHNVFMVNLQ